MSRSSAGEIVEIHLQSNGTYTYNSLFSLGSWYPIGDMIYRPSDNTIFIAVRHGQKQIKEIHQYNYSGVLLDSLSVSSAQLTWPNAMFCSGGKIFIQDGGSTLATPVYEVETNPLSLLPSTVSYAQPGISGDAASAPECCNPTGSNIGSNNFIGGSELVNPTPVPTVDTFTIRDVGNTEVDTVVDKLKIITKLNQYSGNKKI